MQFFYHLGDVSLVVLYSTEWYISYIKFNTLFDKS